MQHIQSTNTSKRWNVMRTDRDIHPVTGEEEAVPQCIFVSEQPPCEDKLSELREKYNAPDIWVEAAWAYH